MENLLRRILRRINKNEFSSTSYWESRYKAGGNSGSGSYGKLAGFKARVINDFIKKNNINSLIEFGCGDGNQLTLAEYPQYIGLDVSATTIALCIEKFKADKSKSFFLYNGDAYLDNHHTFYSDVSMSLDVLYHLVENSVYENYLKHLFGSAKKYVIIYSSNIDTSDKKTAVHERHRKFTDDVSRLHDGWTLMHELENEYKPKDWQDEEGSIANFYFYKRTITE